MGPGSVSSAYTGHSPFSYVVIMILPQEKGTLGWVGGKSGASFSPAGCWARLPCFHQIPVKGPNQKKINQTNQQGNKCRWIQMMESVTSSTLTFASSLWVGDFRSRENVSGLSNWGLKEFYFICYVSLYIVEMDNWFFCEWEIMIKAFIICTIYYIYSYGIYML